MYLKLKLIFYIEGTFEVGNIIFLKTQSRMFYIII